MRSNWRFIIVIVFIFCLFTACEKTTRYPAPMLRAEGMLDTCPDSALSVLVSYQDSVSSMGEPVRMYYNLLLVKARDKNYITHTSDSLISEVVRYYEREGTTWQLAQAYYYLGSVYQDLDYATLALDYFQKALDCSEHHDDLRFKGLIYTQIGTVLMYQALYDEALPAFRQAYHYDCLERDSAGLVFDLRDIGRYYDVKGEKDSSLYYFSEAWRMARERRDSVREVIVAREYSSIYLRYDDVEMARLMMTQADSLEVDADPSFSYGMWADIYKTLGQLDSSAYFHRKTLLAGNVYVKCNAYRELYEIADAKGDYEEARHYMRQYVYLVDSIQNITITESVGKMHALYNRQKMETEKNRLQTENRYLRIEVLSAIAIALLSLIVYYQYSRRKRLRLELQKRKVENILEIQRQKSEEVLKDNLLHIAELEAKLEEFQQTNDRLEKIVLDAEKAVLEKQNLTILAEREKQQALLAQFKESEIYHVLIEKIKLNTKASEEDLQKLGETIDKMYDGFTLRLRSLHPSIKPIDMYMCYLIKIDIPLSGICSLLLRSSSGVSMARKRLSVKILGDSSSIDSFDELIRYF